MVKFSDLVELIRPRKKNYALTFAPVWGQNVLIDLAKFCRAGESCWRADAREHAVLEGRREVWLRIQQHLRLSSEQLARLYSGQNFQLEDENG